jgi:predicted kinase
MQKEITLLIGLPGSGKSEYIKKTFNNGEYTVVDDPRKAADIPLEFNKHLIIADCHLCREQAMDGFKTFADKNFPDVKINYVYFENNPEQCLKNAAFRNDGRIVEPTIRHMSKTYKIPEGVIAIPIFNTDKLKKKSKLKF